jgi:hypothetical protein
MVSEEGGASNQNGNEPVQGAENQGHITSLKSRVEKTLGGGVAFVSGLGRPARVAIALVAAILVSVLLLWLIDKFFFYYLTRSYIDEVAQVLDLNPHLANALVVATFVATIFFARFIYSFSRTRRFVGIAGIAALLIGHSLVLWYGTKDQFFDRQRTAIKCYVLTRDGQVTYGEHAGTDPSTGRQCRPVTPEMLERLQKYAAGKRPQVIATPNPVFFDPRSGEPIVWYYKDKENIVEIFDLMGFHPDTGEELLPVTKEVAEIWKKQAEERGRHVPKLIPDPEKYVFFDPRNGQARAWFWLGANGRYEFYDSAGFQPQTGDKLLLVTREIVNEWKNTQKNPTTAVRAPNRVQIASNTVFFDPVTGSSKLWYWRRGNGDFEFFDGPGFHPQNGELLQSFTKEALIQYQKEVDEKTKQLKVEQERIEAEQKAKQDAEAAQRALQQQKASAEQLKREEEARRLSEAARRCDALAANPGDAHRVADGVLYGALKVQSTEAVEACEIAVTQNPNELRFQYQLARALELAGDNQAHTKNRQKALEIHQRLVKAGYAAAFDNLASLYYWDRKDLATAVALWRKGVDLGDSDSMLTLADLIEKGRVNPQGPNETPIELYKRAADLGNENGARAYQAELAKAQQIQQQQIQQLQQQQIMMQFMGTVLRNIH